MSMDHVIIKIDNLRREFIVGGEKVKALRGVSFQIRNGEFTSPAATSSRPHRAR